MLTQVCDIDVAMLSLLLLCLAPRARIIATTTGTPE